MDSLTARAREVLDELLEGNERFRSGKPRCTTYANGELAALAEKQTPKVAIVACSDSRVVPEVIFDQPIGSVFASRVPANVASDSAKWMLELAVGDFQVPLVLVLGHSGCLAVGQMLEGDKGGAGGMHRTVVLAAVNRAQSLNPDDLYIASVEENAKQTVEHLVRDSYTVRSAIQNGTTSILGGVYEMKTGLVRILDTSAAKSSLDQRE